MKGTESRVRESDEEKRYDTVSIHEIKDENPVRAPSQNVKVPEVRAQMYIINSTY